MWVTAQSASGDAQVNYYEHHLGDWAAATAHLTWDEDMAYSRLLRAYYHGEQPIPAGQQYRLARASTPAQRKAVDAVLAEFFTLVDGAYRQKRADEEIARFQDKQRKAKASANARWADHERNANAMRTHTERKAKAVPTQSEGNALQSPVSRHQSPSSDPSDPRVTHAHAPEATASEPVEAAITAIRAAYPAGTYRQASWLKAEHWIHQLVNERGVSPIDLLAAATAYGQQTQATGSSGTQFVMSPAKFFDPTCHEWRGPFTLPKTSGQIRQDENIAAGQAWLAQEQRA